MIAELSGWSGFAGLTSQDMARRHRMAWNDSRVAASENKPGGGSTMTANHKTAKRTNGPHAIEGVEGVEIKVTIRPDQELQGLRALELDEDSAEVRVIYFYDTAKLDLYNAGVVLRARLVKGDDDDSTVKIRPIEPEKVSQRWSNMEGFKIEADSAGSRIVCSASLTLRQNRDEIDEVTKGKRPIYKLFSKDQVRFLSEFYQRPVDFEQLRSLGPIRVLHWTTEHKGIPYELASEEWRLPDGENLLEVSIKVEPDEAAKARRAFDSYLRELGLDPAGDQETKTRTALEYFARTLKSVL
jgi:hypothetical protein